MGRISLKNKEIHTGRPKSYTTECIKEIIDECVIFHQGRVLLSASKVAEYAQQRKGLDNFKYYVINRNEECKKYLEEINERIKENASYGKGSAALAFEPIDIEAYQNMSKDKLGQALANLNILLENMAENNRNLLEQRLKQNKLLDKANMEIIALKEEINNYKEQLRQVEMKNMIDVENEKSKQLKVMRQNEELKTAMHILWDEEAENVMKEVGIFDEDGKKPDLNKVMCDIDESIEKVEKDSKLIEGRFFKRLKGLE